MPTVAETFISRAKLISDEMFIAAPCAAEERVTQAE
jgi:hypothetical protein